jgi:hypothetical protein
VAVTLGSNISSLKAQQALAGSTSALGRAFERLSSGLRINRASDDAAGLAVSSNLNASSRVYSAAHLSRAWGDRRLPEQAFSCIKRYRGDEPSVSISVEPHHRCRCR